MLFFRFFLGWMTFKLLKEILSAIIKKHINISGMSTKIYNAVKFKDSLDLTKVISWLESVKPDIKELVYDFDRQKILDKALRKLDETVVASMGWCAPLDAPESAISRAIDEERKDRSQREDEQSITLFWHKNTVYGFFHTSDFLNKWKKSFEKAVFDDYSYWNNTDKPDNVTEGEWDERRDTWKDILGSSWVPDEVGINMLLSYSSSFDRSVIRFMKEYRANEKDVMQSILDKVDKNARARRLYVMFDQASWILPLEGKSPISSFLSTMMEIEKDKNKDFNDARQFLVESVFNEIPPVDHLFARPQDMADHLEQKRQDLYKMDIPKSLRTPPFEKRMLEESIGWKNSPSAPRKKI